MNIAGKITNIMKRRICLGMVGMKRFVWTLLCALPLCFGFRSNDNRTCLWICLVSPGCVWDMGYVYEYPYVWDDDVYFGFDAWICLLLTRPSD